MVEIERTCARQDDGRHALLLTVTFALVLGGLASTRGLNIDQSLSYIGAFRMCEGQGLYEDFHVPFGPVAILLLSPFVCLAPTGGWGMVVASSILNAAGVWLLFRFVEVGTQRRDLAVWGGALSSVLFLPPFGTYYNDHLAYVLVLASGYLLISPEENWKREAGSALALVLAYHTKQTIGIAGVLALAAGIFLSGYYRNWTLAQAGRIVGIYAGAHVFVVAALYAGADLDMYLQYAVLTPAEFATEDDHRLTKMVRGVVLPFRVDPVKMVREGGLGRMLFYPFVIVMYWAYARCFRLWRRTRSEWPERSRDSRRLYAIAFLVSSTVVAAGSLGRSMWHCLFGTGALLGFLVDPWWPRWRAKVSMGLAGVIGVIAIVHLHRPAFGADRYFADTELYPIQIGNSAAHANVEATKAVVDWLRGRPGKIAALDDRAYLVPLAIHRAPQQPSLYFHDGLTVPSDREARRRWQEEYLAALRRRKVKFVITAMDSDTMFRTGARDQVNESLGYLWRGLKTDYVEAFRRDGYVVWARRSRKAGADG